MKSILSGRWMATLVIWTQCHMRVRCCVLATVLSTGFMVVDARATDAQLGGDVNHRKVPMEDWIKSCVYDLAPVAARTEVGDPNAGGRIGRQITLTGLAEWELAVPAVIYR